MTPPSAEPLRPSARELPARAGGLASYPPVERWDDWQDERLGRGTADRTWTTSTAIAPLRMALIDHISVAIVKCAA